MTKISLDIKAQKCKNVGRRFGAPEYMTTATTWEAWPELVLETWAGGAWHDLKVFRLGPGALAQCDAGREARAELREARRIKGPGAGLRIRKRYMAFGGASRGGRPRGIP